MSRSTIKLYKIILLCAELFFGIPVLGGIVIISLAWAPLWILIALHLIGLVLEKPENVSEAGHIVGIIGNALGMIPIVGMIFHIIIGVILLIEVINQK